MNTTSRKPRIRVEREHDAGGAEVAAHHVLHADRQRDRVVIEVAVHAIGDGAIVEQRGIHLVHGLDSRCSSPRTLRNVSCWPAKEASGRSSAVAEERTATANSSAPLARIFRQAVEDLLLQARRERGREHPAANLLADDGEPLDVVDIERRQRGADPLIQAVLCEKVAVGVRGGREAAGHRNAQDRPGRRSSRRSRRSCRRPVRRLYSSAFQTE